MKRKAEAQLFEWKNSKYHKPLLIKGARQVGKTYSVMAFGEQAFKQVVHLDFTRQPNAADYFRQSLDPKSIIRNIELDRETTVDPETTLLFFDEIQVCGEALTSLKYFSEDAPEYHLIAAGSLLGVTLKRQSGSYPVGKTLALDMHPMDFEEFLWASGKAQLAEAIRDHFENDESFALHDSSVDLFRNYLLVGGMPEAVQAFCEEGSFEKARLIQSTIASDYIADMLRFADATDSAKIHAVWRSLPNQLAKENTKFKYQVIGKNARAREYYYALEWLVAAGMITLCTQVTDGLSPLRSFEDAESFKAYYEDTGLLAAANNTLLSDLLDTGPKTARFRGSLTENYVIQQLVANGIKAYYWGTASRGEVDFVFQDEQGNVIPIEVKSGSNVSSMGLNAFIRQYQPAYSIRASTKNFGFENGIKSVPLYAVHCIT
ncbi:MAG: ATP-binding protein [Coriobacteriia bacterium]|nr:ATP-binding protein [Coriobacteriia bacterium]